MALKPLLRCFFAVAAFVPGLLAGAGRARGEEPRDATPIAPDRVLAEAFHRRYACTISGIAEISTRRGTTEALLRTIDVAAKFIDGRLHTYALFRAPEYVRGMAFLGIEPETPGGEAQQFVYLPSLGKIRRVGAIHRADSFLGTDLSYHDFERRRMEDYRLDPLARGEIAGEAVYELLAYPRFHSDYASVAYSVATSDYAILGTRYSKRGDRQPYKQMEMPRSAIHARGECRIPTIVRVANLQSKTTTELTIRDLRLDADLDDSLFSMSALATGRRIPGLRRPDPDEPPVP